MLSKFKSLKLVILLAIVFFVSACQPVTLPTIGRTQGDLPMTLLLKKEGDCFQVTERVYFEAPFATGMSFGKEDCLSGDHKVGQKTVEELANMHVSVTFDGEFYIIKNGY